MDPVVSGVGASQVIPYVSRLAERGFAVELHSFEEARSSETEALLQESDVAWRPHPFGRLGTVAGVQRVLRGALAIRGAQVVHARSDLAAAAALLARPLHWVWDMRSFWTDQRIALGMVAVGSPEERVMRLVERRSAASASAIVTLADSAIEVVRQRHGDDAARKITVIPTCVELDRFPVSPLPEGPTRLLLSGTLNRYYDVQAMIRLATELRRRRDVTLDVLAPVRTAWHEELAAAGATFTAPTPPSEIPRRLAASHVGLSVCRLDAGPSLKAAMPTKVAEFLASGRPVVVNEGLGDLPASVREGGCGVVLSSTSASAIAHAAMELDELLRDPALPDRCRTAAETHFDVERGVDRLAAIYMALA